MGNNIPRIGKWGKLISSTLDYKDSIDDAAFLTKYGDKATENLFNITKDKAEKINPFYEERKKWEAEEDKEKERQKRKQELLQQNSPAVPKKLPDTKEDNRCVPDKNGYVPYDCVMKKNNNSQLDILLKKNNDISEEEVKLANKYSWYETKDKELSKRLNNKVSSWYDEAYGKKSSQDATGRTINPQQLQTYPQTTKELRTKEGYNIDDGFKKVSDSLNAVRDDDGDYGASILQKTLNGYDYEPKLKEDNDLGPKTTERLKASLVDYGAKDVQSRIPVAKKTLLG